MASIVDIDKIDDPSIANIANADKIDNIGITDIVGEVDNKTDKICGGLNEHD